MNKTVLTGAGGLDTLIPAKEPITKAINDLKNIAEETGYKRTTKGRPKKNLREVTKSSQEGVKEGETRATFIVKEITLEKIKSISYWERVSIKQVVNEALKEYISKYEKKQGNIKEAK